MTYMILDSTGSAIASFDDETAARATLRAIVAHEPEAADHVVLIAYDDDGRPQGEAATYEDLPPAATIEHSECVLASYSRPFSRPDRRVVNRYVAVSSWGTRIDFNDGAAVVAAHN
jgi:hypothetical protein